MADDAILVVDDLPQNVRLLDAVLTPYGFSVLTAASGEEAWTCSGGTRLTWSCSTSSCPASTGTRSAGGSRQDPATSSSPW